MAKKQPRTDGPPTEHDALLAEARRLRKQIEQIFVDAASWNDNAKARKNGAQPMNPDPTGELARLAAGLDRVIAADGK